MKSTLLSIALTALILSIGVAACKKTGSSDGSTTTGNNIPPETMVTAGIKGSVMDQAGKPVQGAVVTSGTASTTTDVNGVFSFSNISLSSRFGFVKVSKSGYFTGSRSIITAASSSNFVSIQLLNRNESGNFSATSGGNAAPYSGDTVT